MLGFGTIGQFAIGEGPSEFIGPDKFWQPYSESVRFKQGLAAREHQFLAFVKAAPFPESVTEDRWHQPWSEPPIFKIKRSVPWHQFQPYEETARFPEVVSEDRWHFLWSEPVRTRYFNTALQSFTSREETPLVNFSYFNWLSEPVRKKPTLLTGDQPFIFQDIPPSFTFSFDWFTWLSEPVRFKPMLLTSDQPFIFREDLPLVNFSYFNWLSEPVRIKLGLRKDLQPVEFLHPFPIIQSLVRLQAIEAGDGFLASFYSFNTPIKARILILDKPYKGIPKV